MTRSTFAESLAAVALLLARLSDALRDASTQLAILALKERARAAGEVALGAEANRAGRN